MAAILDRHMYGCEFIVGDTITVADCISAYVVYWGDENELIDGCPNLKAYTSRSPMAGRRGRNISLGATEDAV